MILDWYEHLMPGEIPKEWMWPFDDVLEEWFGAVSAARSAGQPMGGGDD